MPGIREKVKTGQISPKDALEDLFKVDSRPSESIVKWLRGAGIARYREALKKPAEEPKTEVEEVVEEQPKAKKKDKKKKGKKKK